MLGKMYSIRKNKLSKLLEISLIGKDEINLPILTLTSVAYKVQFAFFPAVFPYRMHSLEFHYLKRMCLILKKIRIFFCRQDM